MYTIIVSIFVLLNTINSLTIIPLKYKESIKEFPALSLISINSKLRGKYTSYQGPYHDVTWDYHPKSPFEVNGEPEVANALTGPKAFGGDPLPFKQCYNHDCPFLEGICCSDQRTCCPPRTICKVRSKLFTKCIPQHSPSAALMLAHQKQLGAPFAYWGNKGLTKNSDDSTRKVQVSPLNIKMPYWPGWVNTLAEPQQRVEPDAEAIWFSKRNVDSIFD